MFEITVI